MLSFFLFYFQLTTEITVDRINRIKAPTSLNEEDEKKANQIKSTADSNIEQSDTLKFGFDEKKENGKNLIVSQNSKIELNEPKKAINLVDNKDNTNEVILTMDWDKNKKHFVIHGLFEQSIPENYENYKYLVDANLYRLKLNKQKKIFPNYLGMFTQNYYNKITTFWSSDNSFLAYECAKHSLDSLNNCYNYIKNTIELFEDCKMNSFFEELVKDKKSPFLIKKSVLQYMMIKKYPHRKISVICDKFNHLEKIKVYYAQKPFRIAKGLIYLINCNDEKIGLV